MTSYHLECYCKYVSGRDVFIIWLGPEVLFYLLGVIECFTSIWSVVYSLDWLTVILNLGLFQLSEWVLLSSSLLCHNSVLFVFWFGEYWNIYWWCLWLYLSKCLLLSFNELSIFFLHWLIPVTIHVYLIVSFNFFWSFHECLYCFFSETMPSHSSN